MLVCFSSSERTQKTKQNRTETDRGRKSISDRPITSVVDGTFQKRGIRTAIQTFLLKIVRRARKKRQYDVRRCKAKAHTTCLCLFFLLLFTVEPRVCFAVLFLSSPPLYFRCANSFSRYFVVYTDARAKTKENKYGVEGGWCQTSTRR